MKITQIHSVTRPGGAANVALDLHRGMSRRGHSMEWWVGSNDGALPDVRVMDYRPDSYSSKCWAGLASGIHRVGKEIGLRSFESYRKAERRWLPWLEHPRRSWDEWRGYESFAYAGVRRLMRRVDFNPDLVQLHNLHGKYFDLSVLPEMSRRFPTVVTLHDAWMLSGHCAHSFDCERWKTGCGHCPDLTISPGIRRDGTRSNWRRKQRIYRNSRLMVVSPSQWLADRVKQSMLGEACDELLTIPNGVDVETFRRGDRIEARRRLGLPLDRVIVLTLADPGFRNRWKDFKTMMEAVGLLTKEKLNLTVIAVGAPEEMRREGSVEWRFIPKILSKEELVCHYQGADLYVHSAHIENFPNMILEAMACGCAVMGTDIGGIPEQIDPDRNGWLTRSHDASDLAGKLRDAILNEAKRTAFAEAGWRRVQNEWTLDRQLDRYESLYREAVRSRLGVRLKEGPTV